MLHLAKASGTSINMYAVFGLTPELGHQSLYKVKSLKLSRRKN